MTTRNKDIIFEILFSTENSKKCFIKYIRIIINYFHTDKDN